MRHLNFELIQRVVLLIAAIVLAFTAGPAVTGEQSAMKLAIGAVGIWVAVVAAPYRFNSAGSEDN